MQADKHDHDQLILNMNQRLKKVRNHLAEKNLQGLLVYSRENTIYLSGFCGTESMLLITPEKSFLLTDFRYIEQAKMQSPHFTVVDNNPGMLDAVKKYIAMEAINRLGIEEDVLSYRQSASLQEIENLVLYPFQEILLEMRSVKDDYELKLMRQAAKIAESALKAVLPLFTPGRAEYEIAAALEYEMRRLGASGESFTAIVASGPRSALPHGVASDKKLQPGEAVVVDFGCIWQGYCSDMTRTFFLGQPEDEAVKVYELVLAAHLHGLQVLQAGMTGAQVDQAARSIIDEQGYGDAFGHSLGHGVGLAVHEDPRLSRTGCDTLRSGQVVTIEPGIYLPGRFGVRIEDTAVVGKDGAASFNSFNKQLTVLPG